MANHPLLDPEKLPMLMALSAIAALAIGMIVFRFTHNFQLALAIGLFLVVADYIGLKYLMGRDDDE